MITQERADVLSKILASDEERAKSLLALPRDEALTQINGLGYDFTLDELREFGEALRTAATQGELLDANTLENVAGGIFTNIDIIIRPFPFPTPLPYPWLVS